MSSCQIEVAEPEQPELDRVYQAAASVEIDVRRSLVVTEEPILQRFPFTRVLDQLVAQAGIPGLTSLALFQQWWDTHNPAPGLGRGPNCDSQVDEVYGPSINGYPYDCRPAPAEGAQASCSSLTDPACAYVPIGLFNRFDLAPVNGEHCGEYRIVYAKASGLTNTRDRNLIIFEAIMPNPLPHQGIKGCRKVADTWADLTKENNIEKRAAALERFYFDGQGNVPPVVHVEHYGDNALGAGQIRTNEFMQPLGGTSIWTLREFKLDKSCEGQACALTVLPVTVKNNPYGPLFESGQSDARADAYQEEFVAGNVAALAGDALSDLSMSTPEEFNSPQAHTSGSSENDYAGYFGYGDGTFRDALQEELNRLGSSLTPDDIVFRAETQSCAGCHRFSSGQDLGGGLVWPRALGFVHVSERDTEVVDGVTRFKISEALTDAFLPARKEVLEEYLNNKPPKVRGNGKTLGGRRSH